MRLVAYDTGFSFNMGHRNIQFSGHTVNEADQGLGHQYPDPSIFYSGSANFPQPNIHSLVPTPLHQCNFDYHHIPERPSYYGMPPYTGTVGIPAERYCRNIPYMDGVGGSFKRKNDEVAPPSYMHQNGGPSSSSVAPPAHYPCSDMNFGARNGEIGTFAWAQSTPNLPYVHGAQGYRMAAINRSAPSFLHHPNPHYPIGYNPNHPPHVATTFIAPVQPTGFRLYRPHRRESTIDPNGRHRNLPHLRVLPEDEVAVLEIPGGYREAGDSIDQHRDMRLDIDQMSYEELLALGENIGTVGTGLTEDFIQNNLKIRNFSSSPACTNREDTTLPDKQTINFCVVCQNDYEYEENIGTLDCGHEYHRECIKKWLHVKNTCPVCKSTALQSYGRNL